MKVTLLEPIGYCAGVANAISMALKVKKEHSNKNVYIFGMLVHNNDVITKLKSSGITTIYPANETALKKIDDGSIVVFTAHGHNVKFDQIALEKKFIVYDAVCSKVKANLTLIKQALEDKHQVIFIGSRNHPETDAALSLGSDVLLYDIDGPFVLNVQDKSPLVINQTTLNILDLKDAYEAISKMVEHPIFQDEICNVTRQRQKALMILDPTVDSIVIVGDKLSSNSRRLLEIAKAYHPGFPSMLVSSINDIDKESLLYKKHVAIASGTSTPQTTIDMISDYLLKF